MYPSNTFLLNNRIHALSEKERFVALIWWHYNQKNKEYISIQILNEEMVGAGYASSNLSRLIQNLRSDKKVLSKDRGKSYRLNIKFKSQLDNEFCNIYPIKDHKIELSHNLNELVSKIQIIELKSFIEECIIAYEHGLYRSAVVMSWIAAIAVLKQEVVVKHLDEFNKEAVRVDSKWKAAKTTDDLSKMTEANFLDRLENISVIGKNVKTELKACLDRRNSCGHPNTYKIENHTTSHHIETLIMNVFREFPKN